MRNLLMIHLESLNYMVYQANKRIFPTLRHWEQKSLSFCNYFSTATSTMMVLSDLAYGGILQNEPCKSLTDGLQKYCYETSLFDDLQKKGYQVKMFGYPLTNCDDVLKSNERYFAGFGIKLEELEPYNNYLKALDNTMTHEKPFAVWACNYINNVSCYSYMEDVKPQSGLDLWETGYRLMDSYVDDLLDILAKKNLLENTTIIFYGDHGDDLFSHGRHQGLMHAIEPYAPLIHTPFWIYDNRFQAKEIDSLIDTTDIRLIVEKLLDLPVKVNGKWGAEDLDIPFRKYSFSRNAYAAQKVREKSFHKGYSLTDGKFLFLASNRGMELFHIGMDAFCQHNLLDYFSIQGSELVINKRLYDKMKFHFPYVLDTKSMSQIKQVFNQFKLELMREVEKIYQYAEYSNCKLEIDFESIYYGWEERERKLYLQTEGQRIPSKIINYLLNSLQISTLFLYGNIDYELKGIYSTIEQYRLVHLEDTIQCQVIYISLNTVDELRGIREWICTHRKETTMIVYLKDKDILNEKIENEFDIKYNYQNTKLFKGTIYFLGKIFDYPDSIVIPENFKVLAILQLSDDIDSLEKVIHYLLSQELDIYLLDNGLDDKSFEVIQKYLRKFQQHIYLKRDCSIDKDSYCDWKQCINAIEVNTEYDWYILYDIKEIELQLWKDKNLRNSLYYIDQLGFDSIDNINIDFEFLQDDTTNNSVYRKSNYFNKKMCYRKAWKKTGENSIKIKNPKVFPLKILSRYFPLNTNNNVLDRKNSVKWEQYYISILIKQSIPIDDKEEFDIYKRYLEGKRVVLYGAGNYGKYFYENMAECSDIVAWVDQEYAYLPWICCKKIQPIEDIKDLEFDAIFIAIVNHKIRQEVEANLIQIGVPKEKIY